MAVGLDRHDPAGTPLMKHVGVAGFQGPELEDVELGEGADETLQPRDAPILEQRRDARSGRQTVPSGQLGGPLAVEEVQHLLSIRLLVDVRVEDARIPLAHARRRLLHRGGWRFGLITPEGPVEVPEGPARSGLREALNQRSLSELIESRGQVCWRHGFSGVPS